MNPFLAASQYQPQPFPSADQFPQPYGYNTLLLSNDSAAILDIPTKAYVARAQAEMANSPGEEWSLTASVNAYVAVRNIESDFPTNDDTWTNDLEDSVELAWGGLSAGDLYEGNGISIGLMPAGNNDQCFIGVYPNSTVGAGFEDFYKPNKDSDFAAFRPYAHQFDISRKRCSGQWKLNSTSIVLLGGSCDLNSNVNSSILQDQSMVPYPFDYMPQLHYVYTGFADSESQIVFPITNPWLDATYAVSVVTTWWARALYMLYGTQGSTQQYDGIYNATDEVIISTRPTLKAMPLLYVVLAVQPVITLTALLVAAALYSVPLGRGFGMVSVLSGFDPSASRNIEGAGLSGKLNKQMSLQVVTERSDLDQDAKVVYRLTDPKPRAGNRTQLQNNQEYA